MKYSLFALHFICITAIVQAQSADFGQQHTSNAPLSENPSAEEVLGASQTAISNSHSFSPTYQGNRENRYTTLLGGYVSTEGESGIHFEVARVYQPRSFGFGAYTSYIRVPKVNYSNWTISGLQLRAGAATGEIKPYGVFDYGMFNLSYIDGKVTLRTGTLGLGGGIEKSIGGKSSVLFDFRWRRFFDYKAERDAFTLWTINAGIKF